MASFIKHVLDSFKNQQVECGDSVTNKSPQARKVLNVGGNSKDILIPEQYDGWEHVLLDIDANGNPDIVCDARELTDLSQAQFDSIYCSHNLEHYYAHDVKKVLAGFFHVLKDDGFVYIRVPDMGEVMKIVARRDLDIEDFLYESPSGPIAVIDIIYGYRKEIERSGHDFYAHKTGFTQKSLLTTLHTAGFPIVFINCGQLEILAIAFKNTPSNYATALLSLNRNINQ